MPVSQMMDGNSPGKSNLHSNDCCGWGCDACRQVCVR